MGVRWTVHPLNRSLGQHAETWVGLAQRSHATMPILDVEFVDRLLHEFGQGDEQLCLQHAKGSGVVSAACILRPKSAWRWASFLPSQAQVGPNLMADAVRLPALLRTLPGYAQQVDLLCIDPELGAGFAPSNALVASSPHALTMNIDLAGSYEDWWQARPKKLRDNLKRYQRRAAEAGLAPRLVVLESPDAVGAGVLRYAELEGRGWKGREGTALGSSPDQLAFYNDLMASRARSGRALVHELWLGDSLAASRLTTVSDHVAVALKTTFDEHLREFAPGRLLMRELVADAFHRWPGGKLEFYTNASVDQLAWATASREIYHLTAWRNPIARLMVRSHRAIQAALRPALHAANGDNWRAAGVAALLVGI